jgi:hypothetical protein
MDVDFPKQLIFGVSFRQNFMKKVHFKRKRSETFVPKHSKQLNTVTFCLKTQCFVGAGRQKISCFSLHSKKLKASLTKKGITTRSLMFNQLNGLLVALTDKWVNLYSYGKKITKVGQIILSYLYYSLRVLPVSRRMVACGSVSNFSYFDC